MNIAVARLEAWMRDYYHHVDLDIGSSGVRDFSIADLCAICDIDLSTLNQLRVRDSESFGGTGLRSALADRWTAGDIEQVMVTHGSSEAIYLVMHLVPDPGDQVVVVHPSYQQLHDIVRWRGCHVVPWPLKTHDGFAVDFPALRRIARQRPKMIVVNFPHNPTGVTISRQEQAELIEIASECGAWLVWDHAFGEISYTDAPLPVPNYNRCITFGTLSKSYGLAGLRVGWCLAPPKLLAQMAHLRDYIALYVSPVLEFFAEQAVRHADTIVALQRNRARQNRRVLLDWAAALPGLVKVRPPDGGVTAFVEFPGQSNVDELCRQLAEVHRTLLVPGSCFGDEFASYARLGFGGAAGELRSGLSRLEKLLRASARTGLEVAS